MKKQCMSVMYLVATFVVVGLVTIGWGTKVDAADKVNDKAKGTETSRAGAVSAQNQVKNLNIRSWAHAAAVIDALRQQNNDTAALTQEEIDRMNAAWQRDPTTPDKLFINAVMDKPVSKYLQQIKTQSNGQYKAILLLDARGINVGQTDVTPTYWQANIREAAARQNLTLQDVTDPKTRKVIGTIVVFPGK